MLQNDKQPADVISGPGRIERLERMEGMTTKVFAAVIVLVIAASIAAAVVH